MVAACDCATLQTTGCTVFSFPKPSAGLSKLQNLETSLLSDDGYSGSPRAESLFPAKGCRQSGIGINIQMVNYPSVGPFQHPA